METETVDGFDIPKRELTEEESNRPITLDRFNEWHVEVGEDFCDQVGDICGDPKIMLGFFIAKYPQFSIPFLDNFNDSKEYYEPLTIMNSLAEQLDSDTEEASDAFYKTLAEFLNLTTHAKKRVNQVLIQVMEN